ncbi:serine/threonine-protein kinase [Streptomyces sp. NPDC058739]|uniref:serine/threonine-protein kinase n=1 Tax=Streptomyces sp. NPDC058739 TaxID=3346618 RepID=UPI0036C8EF3F
MGRLGTGGMGTVYAGLTKDGTRVALKVIHPQHAQDSEFRARFVREVDLSARVQGPCLLRLVGADPHAAQPWLATEYAPGPTLGAHIAAHGSLRDASLYALAVGTAQALAAIHDAGVVHRDIKPANVIMAPAGPRVLDFGIAHALEGTSMTRSGAMVGTPGWISPEQYQGATAGYPADVFAWGALIAYAATGRPPFGTGAPDVVAFRIMSDPPDLEGIPEDLRKLVQMAMAKDVAARPSAALLAETGAALLESQATQIICGDGMAPTRIADAVTAVWAMPAAEGQPWERPPNLRKRLATVAASGAMLTSIVVALSIAVPDGDKDDKDVQRTHVSATATPTVEPSQSPSTGSVAEHDNQPSPQPAASVSTASIPADDALSEYETGEPNPDSLKRAMIPSTDQAEIRVAGTTVQAVFREYRGNARILLPEYENSRWMSAGFDHDQRLMWVWANKPEWDQEEGKQWALTALETTCQVLKDEQNTNSGWRYPRFAVGVLDDAGDLGETMLFWDVANSRDCHDAWTNWTS